MRRIALFMELQDFYEHGIARGVARFAKAKPDWRLYGHGWMFRGMADLELWEGEGIVARIEDQAAADRLSARGLPVVDVAGAYQRPHFRSVTNDDFLTGYKAALHLLSCGFARFAFLGVAGTLWSDQRKAGFEAALRDRRGSLPGAPDPVGAARLPSFERSLAWWEGREGRSQGLGDKGPLAAFLSGLEAPLGLFACNDTTGLRATELAQRLGIEVPASLAILGVDNEDIICELASPSLSSVMLDCEAIGYRAAAALDAILELSPEAPAEGARVAVPPKDVVERESTRIFACEDSQVARAVSYIRAHAHEGIDVSDVLGFVSVSRRSLEMRFRRALGLSPHQEIVRARLGRAKRLLRETSYTMERVAEESGFGALQRFHETFKAAEGISPGEWRRRNEAAR
jgi:LacI family transcriptional regulator